VTVQLHGKNIIAGAESQKGGDGFHGRDPQTGDELPTTFHDATTPEVDAALQRAAAAARELAADRERRASFLEAAAAAIEGLGDHLVERATAESGLPAARINMERGRTCNQLRLFAGVLREGSYLDARIDRAQPDREPIPKPDIRHMQWPLGPVVVFGASNFPLAFSVAGGDTASALAAGCPVVVKAHPAHPGTCELVARAINDAVAASGLPEGTFSLIHGAGHQVGIELVRHPQTRAVAFTGSFAGGTALMEAARHREDPIPFYAEMGSVNPVVLLPGALEERADSIAAGLQQSVCLGAGQFCTNPGLVFTIAGPASDGFTEALGGLFKEAPDATMLHQGIREGYVAGQRSMGGIPGVSRVGREDGDGGPGGADGTPALFTCNGTTFRDRTELRAEVFGPSTLLVSCDDMEQLTTILEECLDGQLTTTIHGTDADLSAAGPLTATLAERSGRVVINGFPTGVEVCPSMHHGGPFPATTDSRSTSVGTAAIRRFLRPVCYQGFPQGLLPAELRDANPDGILRMIDGEWSRE